MTDEIERLVELAEKLDSEGALYRVKLGWSEATGGSTCEVMRCLPVATIFRAGQQKEYDLSVEALRLVLKDLLNKIDFGYQDRLHAVVEAEKSLASSQDALVQYEQELPPREVRGQAQMEVNKMVDADE